MADETLKLKQNFVDQIENARKPKDEYGSAMAAMGPIEIAPPREHKPAAMRPPLR